MVRLHWRRLFQVATSPLAIGAACVALTGCGAVADSVDFELPDPGERPSYFVCSTEVELGLLTVWGYDKHETHVQLSRPNWQSTVTTIRSEDERFDASLEDGTEVLVWGDWLVVDGERLRLSDCDGAVQ